jgi:aspartokinase
LLPAYRKGIPVNIRNTNNPTARGTMIRAQPGQFRRRRHRDCRRQGLLLA